MAICRFDVMVVDRPMFDGQRQRDALMAFQKEAGVDATTAAKSVGLSYPQYNRYLWGRVPLRTDQVGTFAVAYGITKADLSRALGLMDDEIDPVVRERFREAAGPMQVSESAGECAPRVIQRLDPKTQDDLLKQIKDIAGRE